MKPATAGDFCYNPPPMKKEAVSEKSGSGRLFVLSSPSGGGKTSIVSHLRNTGVVNVAISYTTRPPRRGEKNGEAYFFVDEAAFIRMRDNGDFLEWAEVYGNYYGTYRPWVEAEIAAGKNVLLEIDCQGAQQIRTLPLSSVTIFISPPSVEVLRERLLARSDDGTGALEQRLAAAESELAQQDNFDHVVINDRLEDAVNEVAALIRRCISSPH